MRLILNLLISFFAVYTIGFFSNVSAQEANSPNSESSKSESSEQNKKPSQAEPTDSKSTTSANESTPQDSMEEGQKKKKRVSIKTDNIIKLQYGYPKWNTDSTRINSASVLLRDGKSGRIVQISLQETEPDSSIFAGVYQISWANMDQIKAEFYIPPQNLLKTKEGIKKLQQFIAQKRLKRKPFILRREASGIQVIELYDTRQQAMDALKLFKQEFELRKKQDVTLQQQQAAEGVKTEQVINEAALDAAEKAKALAEAAAAARAEAERVRLEQVERRKALERLARQKAFAKEEQEKRKRKAKKFAEDALKAFNEGEFKKAVELFDKSLELDPENKNYMFQYAVSLYRIDQFNKSLVALSLVEDDKTSTAELSFFRGLNYYRLNDDQPALKNFATTKNAKIDSLSPSAAFYEGIILMKLKKWDDATNSFQTVIDTSKDEKLDERAEKFIEQIIKIRAYEAELRRRWRYTGTLGLMYDSNITLSSDADRDQGVASDIEGVRFLTQFGVSYRPINDKKREFKTAVSLLNLYTVDTGFGFNQTLRNSDPFLANVLLPYTWKTNLLEKGLNITVEPGYETIYMSIEDNDFKEILGAAILNLKSTMVMEQTWFSSINLLMRYDQSKLDASTGDNDSSAFKAKGVYNNVIITNKEKGRILIPEVALTYNAASGKNLKYVRADLSTTYVTKWKWNTTWNVRGALYVLNYTDNTNNRGDTNYSLATGLSKKFGKNWNGGLNMTYTINDSNVEANTYNKFVLLNTWSFNY